MSLASLYSWCEQVQAYFNNTLFPVQPATQTPVLCAKGHAMPKVIVSTIYVYEVRLCYCSSMGKVFCVRVCACVWMCYGVSVGM